MLDIHMLIYEQGFFINLPCGAVSALLLYFFFNPPVRPTTEVKLVEKLKHLDLPGFILFVPSVVMLLLGLNWGGIKYPWKSAAIVGLLCGAVLLLMVFAAWQWQQQDEASIPPSILSYRTVLLSSVFSLCVMGGLQLTAYYIPIWFQSVRGDDPTQSGTRLVYRLPSSTRIQRTLT